MKYHCLIVIPCCAWLSGCAVLPPEPEVTLPVSTDDHYAAAELPGFQAEPVRSDWWQLFNDPLLTQLIEQALQNNHDIGIAAANVAAARARLDASEFQRFPSSSVDASAQRSRTSTEVSSANRRLENRYSVGLNARWELDLFGRIQALVDADSATLAATEWDWRDIRSAIAADVADRYLQLRSAQARLGVARKNQAIQAQTLQLTEALARGGRGNQLDVELARASLATTRAQVPALQADIDALSHRLSVLTGQAPGALTETLSAAEQLPNVPAQLAISNPEQLLRRRADLRAAEARLQLTQAELGVSIANLYPRVDLSGLLGFTAREPGKLLSNQAGSANIALGISWPALNLLPLKREVRAREQLRDAAIQRFQQSILVALEEVETAAVRFAKGLEQQQFSREAEQASERAAELAKARYRAGASTFLPVLEAEERLLAAAERRTLVDLALAVQVVALYRALGGGWSKAQ